MLSLILGGKGPAAFAKAAPKPVLETPQQIELCGDVLWFADQDVRHDLRDKVAAKIIVGPAAQEIERICPSDGRTLGAGAVLRLGGSYGSFGESDIEYAFRQLSRAVHPDKNPDIPHATDAFKRLGEANGELRDGLEQSRNQIQHLCEVMGRQRSPDMMSRPQEALFAEAARVVFAVLGLSGEGSVHDFLIRKGFIAFGASTSFAGCDTQRLLSCWWESPQILDSLSSASFRSAYDCAPKRLRAQFLCALNRCTFVEAKRNSGCVRATWQGVMTMFPEVSLCRDFWERLRGRVFSIGFDNEENVTHWAKGWRTSIEILFSFLPKDKALSVTSSDVETLAASLWADIANWAITAGMQDHLSFFRSEGANEHAPVAAWAFVPAVDLILTVGEGLLGRTAEGFYLFEKLATPAPLPTNDPPPPEHVEIIVPERLQEHPRPTADDLWTARQSSFDKGYAADKLPKGIVPGVTAKWGIGLWCTHCNAYVAMVKRDRDSGEWWVAEAGQCYHWRGITASHAPSSAQAPSVRADAVEPPSASALSADDLARAVQAARQTKAKTMERRQGDMQLIDQLEEAVWGRTYTNNVTGLFKRCILENGLADVTCGQHLFKVLGDPSPGDWKVLKLTINGKSYDFEEEQLWWSKNPALDLRQFFKTDAQPARSRSRSRPRPAASRADMQGLEASLMAALSGN